MGQFVVYEGLCQTLHSEQDKDAFGVEFHSPGNPGYCFWPLLQACTGFSQGTRDRTTGNGHSLHHERFDGTLRKISPQKKLSSIGTGQWWGHYPWKCSEHHLRTGAVVTMGLLGDG